MSGPSLTRRLIWTLTIAAVVLWLAAALLTTNTLRTRLNEAFDGGLKETAERLLALAVDSLRDDGDENHSRPEAHEVPQFDETGSEYILYQVRLRDGTVVLRSHDAPGTAFSPTLTDGFTNVGPWRVFTIGTPRGDVFIQVAEADRHRAESLWSSVLSLLLPIGLLVPLSALGIFLAVRSGLRPVRDFSAAIAARHASNLAPIGDAGLPSELKPVAHAVDGLMARVRAALDAERAFAANSAHELRTPIAGSLAQTQRLIAELGDGPARVRAEQIEASLSRLRTLSGKLLQLSRADAGIGAVAQPIDLLPALSLMVDDLKRSRAVPGAVEFEVDPGAILVAPMDVDAFGIAVRNLLDNAAIHGSANEPIRIAVRTGVVEISNAGPVVPADALGRLTARFVRGTTEAEGSGLGLAIADTILRQAGGRLDLVSPRAGRDDGFLARVTLPLGLVTS